MYEAKTERHAAIVVFEPEMLERAWSRLRVAGGAGLDRPGERASA